MILTSVPLFVYATVVLLLLFSRIIHPAQTAKRLLSKNIRFTQFLTSHRLLLQSGSHQKLVNIFIELAEY